MKTHELIGPALDWAVAKCEGLMRDPHGGWVRPATESLSSWRYGLWAPSSNWAQGGPIIEREGINLAHFGPNHWGAHPAKGDFPFVYGSTPLVAAMRCFVSSELGDEVETPYRN